MPSIVIKILRELQFLSEVLTHEEAQNHIDKVTSDMKFDKSRIGLSDETHEFELNGKKMVAAGVAYRDSGKIDMYPGKVTHENIRGIIAHEVGHQKFNDAIKKADTDARVMYKDPGPAPDPNHKYWWGRTGGSDAIMTYDGGVRKDYVEKYPHYDAMHHAYTKHHHDVFAAAGGVSDYSNEYWKGYRNGKIDGHTAVHETLAEMHRLKYETGKLPRADAFMGNRLLSLRKKIKTPSGEEDWEPAPSKAQHVKNVALWRNLYDVVDKIHNNKVHLIKRPV